MAGQGRSSEEDLVARFVAALGSGEARVGIGDDAAVLDIRGPLVVTTDLLVENVDFRRHVPLRFVAMKALAANVSDVAAMGARAESFVLGLALPPELLDSIDGFIEGLADAAKRWKVSLIGGDLSSSTEMTVTITAFGKFAEGASPLLRSGANPGEHLFVSRALGGAAAGLVLLERGWRITESGDAKPPADLPGEVGYAQREFAASAIRRQVAPEPEAELGDALARSGAVTACIDISDGLSTDLHRLCRASGVGAVIEQERVPRFPDLDGAGFSLGIDPDKAVLHGGEELALLFTSRRREAELSRALGRPVYRIGTITASAGVALQSPSGAVDLPPQGFDHFSRGQRER